MGVLRAESPECMVVIHHDPTGPPLPAELFGERVVACPDPTPVTWGDWSIADAILRPLGWLVDHDDFDWAVVISGQDYPIMPVREIEADLARSEADALIRHAPIDAAWAGNEGRLRYLSRMYVMPNLPGTQRIPARARRVVRGAGFVLGRFESRVWFRSVRPMGRVVIGRRVRRPPLPAERLHGGSDWFSLNRRAARIVVERAREEGPLVQHLRHTLAPSEAFFHTVLANEPGLVLDGDNRRYILFEPGSAHPITLGAGDVEAAAANGAHFARKFDLATEPGALDAADRLRAQRAGLHPAR